MAYEKFTLNFTLIDQIVFEMITNQFTPFPVAAHLAYLCASNLSLMFAKRELSVYIEESRISQKKIN